MSDLVLKAVELGKEATARGVRAGASFVEKTKDLNIGGGGARFFEEADEKDQEIKKLLDANGDRQKLEGMKKLIALISKGRDVADFFPSVVKNVVTKNHEVRKLVYIFLVRYAEQEPDIALLSINTLQKDLTDSNQLIRALALRVLSNIRIDIIIPIVVLAIKKCIGDLSPYVRKTAALAIPKIYSLEPSQKDGLVEIIETLLNERSTLVIGSIVAAFNEVCPERFDLIHKHFRKLCYMLIDIDEWGQIQVLNLLLRYARTQFLDPNTKEEVANEAFYSDEEEDSDKKKDSYSMDSDLRLLLNSCIPLLNNRNSGVVLAVATLFFYLAPRAEFPKVGKPLVGLLGTHPEMQFVILSNISTMASTRAGAFEPFLRKFYVLSTDPFYLKVLKLEIITKIATEANISQILKEFQSYVKSPDKRLATEAIQAIGRCAILLPSVAESCLVGLMALISSKNEALVGESVVVIKSLLQLRSSDNEEMIRSLAKSYDKILVPMAKASIIWLIGEYCEKIPKIAPDILRKGAQNFVNEDDIVKLEILNLGAKLFIARISKSEALFSHVLNLAKYDLNYDIRDRGRLLRALCFEKEKVKTLGKNAKRILFANKPAPQFETVSAGRERFVTSTLSHILNKPVNGYQDLPDFPETAPDSSTREVQEERWQNKGESLFLDSDRKKTKSKKDRKYDNLESFLNSDEDRSEEEDYSDRDSYDDRSRSRSRSYSRSPSRSRSRSYSRSPSRSRSRSYSRSRSRSRSYSRTPSRSRTPSPYSDEEVLQSKPLSQKPNAPAAKPQEQPRSSQPQAQTSKPRAQAQSLLDFDDEPSQPTSLNSLSKDLTGLSLTPTAFTKPTPVEDDDAVVVEAKLPTIKFKLLPLLSHLTGRGLSAEYFFGRRTSLYPDRMISIQLVLTNRGQKPITNIRVGTDNLEKWAELIPFNPIGEIAPEEAVEVNLNVDFNQKATPINFQLITDDGKFSVKMEPPFGELLKPKSVSLSSFKILKAKLGGMFESSSSVGENEVKWETNNILKRVYRAANVSPLDNYGPASTVDEFNFHGFILSSQKPVLITVKAPADGKIKFSVNSEDMVSSSTLLKSIKSSLTESL